MSIGTSYNYTPSGYPFMGVHHVGGQIDGSGYWDPAYSTVTLGLGSHTLSLQMYESYLGGGLYATASVQITIYIYPSFNVTVSNGFDGGEIYVNNTLYTNVSASGVTIHNVHQNATLNLTAVDNQTPPDGLLRRFHVWTNNIDNNFAPTTLSISPVITSDAVFTVNFYRQPSQPQNLQIVQNSTPVHLTWNSTSESDFQYWEVWRRITMVHGRVVVEDWTMISTTTTNAFIDPDYTPNASDPKTLTYKLRAKGALDMYSSYSSEVALNAEQLFYKKQGGKQQTTLPTELALSQNYPNPFNPTTMISYALPEATYVRVAIYSTMGVEVEVLVDGTVAAGLHEVSFNAANRPSGIYFCKISAGKYSDVKRMLLLK